LGFGQHDLLNRLHGGKRAAPGRRSGHSLLNRLHGGKLDDFPEFIQVNKELRRKTCFRLRFFGGAPGG
ncbi:MAG: hypothetical protein LWW84_15040, partial [Azovibrio sp.]|nr:hypothetical protein [Azovibrio sp.]